MHTSFLKRAAAGTAIAAMLLPSLVTASSHREAPLASTLPQADLTDFYMFKSPDRPDTVTLALSVLPFEEPAGGPNFYNFGDNVLYELHVDNDGDAKPNISYQFQFRTINKNRDSFLVNLAPVRGFDGPNTRQVYDVTRVEDGRRTLLGSNLPVPPSNIGATSMPAYETELFQPAVRNIADGIKVFAGQTDDAFFVDLGGVFDLLSLRNPGVDGLKGYNVQTIAIQVPISQLTRTKNQPAATSPDAVIGGWAQTSMKSTRILRNDGGTDDVGQWVGVSRLGSPLVNEVVIPLKDKDRWNASVPRDDVQFGNYVLDPELGRILRSFGINTPPAPRDDLVAIFLTGLPGPVLTQPSNVRPSEMLRLNTGVAVSANPSRLGVLGGDIQGFPNGRRLFDDVTDISIRAVAGAVYPLFHPEFTADPAAGVLGDGVDFNDRPFRCTFPYFAMPFDGTSSIPHGNATTQTSLAQCNVPSSSSSSAQTSSAASSAQSSVTSSAQSSGASSSSSAPAGVTCNGLAATIYVNQQGKVVGGPLNGQNYLGYLEGTQGNDVMVGTFGSDTFFALGGDDTVCALAGNDYVNTAAGNDTVFGSDGSDTVDLGAGNDSADGGIGNDTLNGDAGTDSLTGGDGTDICRTAETTATCESFVLRSAASAA